MNYKKLLFETEITNALKEIYHMMPLLTQDALPHALHHLEGVLYIHDNGHEEIPYMMQEDGTVVYLNFNNTTEYRELQNKHVILIGKKDSANNSFEVHDIQED